VLEGVLLIGRFACRVFSFWIRVSGCCTYCLRGVLFLSVLLLSGLLLDPRFWILYLLFAGCFVLKRFAFGSSLMNAVLIAYKMFYS